MEPLNSHGIALVTGGASGMGLAIVERLARDGFRVVMADRLSLIHIYTRVGKAMRAVGMNPKAARLVGVNLTRIRMMVWALSGLISAVAALLITPKILITPDIGHIAILALSLIHI